MKGWQIGALALVAVVGGGAAAAPVVVGMQAEQHFKEALSRLSQPGAEWELQRYQRGWMGAEALSRLTFERDDGEPVVIEFDHTITHGPYATAGLFEAVSRPRMSGEAGEAAAFYFPDTGPLTGCYRVGFDGAQRLDFTIPPYRGPSHDDKNEQIDWSGLNGQLRLSPERLEGEFSGASLTVSSEADGGRVLMAGLAGRVQADRQGGLWYGEGALGLDGIDILDPESGQAAALGKVGIRFYQRLEQGGVTAGFDFSSLGLKLDGHEVARIEYAVELTRLDPAALAELQARSDALARSGLSRESLQLELQKLMAEMMPQLLAGKPGIAMPRLVVETPEGRLDGRFQLDYIGEGPANPMALITAVKADAELSLPRAMAELIAMESSRSQMEMALAMQAAAEAEAEEMPSQEALEAMLRETAAEQVELLMAQGLVTREGEILKTRARFEGGRLYVNDELMLDLAGGM